MISTIPRGSAEGAQQTVARNYQLDSFFGTELHIKLKDLLFDNGNLANIMYGNTSSSTRMDTLDVIDHQLFFTASSFWRQPTISQNWEPLASQTLPLAATVIHSMLSELSSIMNATVKYSQEEYRHTFCASPVILFTLDATTFINHTLVAHFITPLWYKAAMIGTLQFPSAVLRLDWDSSISFSTHFPLFWRSSAGIGTQSTLSGLVLLYFIPRSIPLPF